MNLAHQSNIADFKGIYYNESKDQKFFEGGAHFRYKELYIILEKLKKISHNDIVSKEIIIQRNDSNCKENNDFYPKQSRTRNNQNNIERAITSKPTTTRYNQKNYFLNQCLQSKYVGISLYPDNKIKKNQVPKYDNKLKDTKVVATSTKPKCGSFKRNQSEGPQSNMIIKTTNQTARQNGLNGRDASSNTQRAIEYSDKLKTNYINSGRANQSRNVVSISNANPNTYAFSNGSIKENKSRNSNRVPGIGLFDNSSFYTKSDCRGKDQKEVTSTSIKNTIDKIGVINKTISSRKVYASMTMINRIQKGSIEKYQKACSVNKTQKKRINSSIDSQKKKMKKGFLITSDK